MISGIYKLTFKDGSYYIGKSNDIKRRWEQHAKGLSSGKHTKKMQSAYDTYGDPTYEILIECHPHHTDFLEEYYIAKMWGPRILNSTKPTISKEDIIKIDDFTGDMWNFSTFDHLMVISNLNNKITKLEEDILSLKSGTMIESLEEDVTLLETWNIKLRKELTELKSRGLLSRIFNWEK